ncbi:MAG: hypothetical protein ACOYLF_17900, partial [Blastocatellia bacterium]
TIRAINRQISLFTSPDYYTDDELKSAKTLLDVNEIYDREKPSEYAHTVSFWWASSGLDYYANYIENLRKVTRADISRYVERYIRNKPRVVAVLIAAEDQRRIGLTEAELLVRQKEETPVEKGTAGVKKAAKPKR